MTPRFTILFIIYFFIILTYFFPANINSSSSLILIGFNPTGEYWFKRKEVTSGTNLSLRREIYAGDLLKTDGSQDYYVILRVYLGYISIK